MSPNPVQSEDPIPQIQRRLEDLHRKVENIDRKLDLLLAQRNQIHDTGYCYTPLAGNAGWSNSHLGSFGGLAGEALTSASSIPIPQVVPGGAGAPGQVYPQYPPCFWQLDPVGITGGLHPSQHDQELLPQDPSILRGSAGVDDATWANHLPAPAPSPTGTLKAEPWGSGSYSRTNHDYNNPPSGGLNGQPVGGWAGDLGSSPSSVVAKPERIKNNNRSEQSSSPASQGSTSAMEKRIEMERQKNLRIQEICKGLDIGYAEDRLTNLQSSNVWAGPSLQTDTLPEGNGGRRKRARRALES